MPPSAAPTASPAPGAALLALLLAACREKPIAPERSTAPSASPGALARSGQAPALVPLATLGPAPPGAAFAPASSACLAARAPAGAARYDWGKEGPPYLPEPAAPGEKPGWMKLARSHQGEDRARFCYPRGEGACLPADQIKRSYADACCEILSMVRVDRGPTLEAVTAPEVCAGVLVCCYEGPIAHGSGPGRPLLVGDAPRAAALQRCGWG